MFNRETIIFLSFSPETMMLYFLTVFSLGVFDCRGRFLDSVLSTFVGENSDHRQQARNDRNYSIPIVKNQINIHRIYTIFKCNESFSSSSEICRLSEIHTKRQKLRCDLCRSLAEYLSDNFFVPEFYAVFVKTIGRLCSDIPADDLKMQCQDLVSRRLAIYFQIYAPRVGKMCENKICSAY